MDQNIAGGIRCSLCGKDVAHHLEYLPRCFDTLEAIVKQCYLLTMCAPRPIVLARLVETFPETQPELLESVERALNVARLVSSPDYWPSMANARDLTMPSSISRSSTSSSYYSTPVVPPPSPWSHPSTPTAPPTSPDTSYVASDTSYLSARSFFAADEHDQQEQ